MTPIMKNFDLKIEEDEYPNSFTDRLKKSRTVKNYTLYLIAAIILILAVCLIITAYFALDYKSSLNSIQTSQVQSTAATKTSQKSTSSSQRKTITITSKLTSKTSVPGSTTSKDPFGPGPWENPSLSDDLMPSDYHLNVRTFAKNDLIDGELEIDAVNMLDGNRNILMHASKSLFIQNPEVYSIVDMTRLKVQTSFYYEPNNYYVIVLDSPLKVNDRIRIYFEFERTIDVSENEGIFSRDFVDSNGSLKQIVATKFKQANARKVMPCFDEPRFRARFNFTITHPPMTRVLTNFPLIKTEKIQTSPDPNDYSLVSTFKNSYALSVHMFGWVIIPDSLGSVTYKDNFKGKNVTIFCKSCSDGNSKSVDFALEATYKLLGFLTDTFFNNSLPLEPDRIDLIAIPDLSAEDGIVYWGSLLFNERHLMYDSERHASLIKQKVLLSLSRSLVAVWTENLIGPKYWEHTSFNEALTHFLKYKVINQVYPELQINDDFVTEQASSMWRDAFSYSQNSTGSTELSKSASVLKAIEQVVGEEKFLSAIKTILKDYAFKTLIPNDLFDLFSKMNEFPDLSIADMANSWINEPNYPIVRIKTTSESKTTFINFEQSRMFLYNKAGSKVILPEVKPHDWQVFLECKAGKDGNSAIEKFKVFFKSTKHRVSMNDQYNWVVCNPSFTGFYLINYSPDLFQNITVAYNQNINNKNFSDVERAYFMHSYFLLSYAGETSYKDSKFVFDYFTQADQNEFLLSKSVIVMNLNKIASLLKSTSQFLKFASSISSATQNSSDVWQGSGDDRLKIFKHNMVDLFCQLQLPSCVAFVSFGFSNFTSGGETNVNLKQLLLKYTIQIDDYEENWDFLRNRSTQTSDAHEEVMCIDALTYTKKAWLLTSLLDDVKSDAWPLKISDFARVVRGVGNNQVGRYELFDFVEYHTRPLIGNFGKDAMPLSDILNQISTNFNNDLLLNQLVDLTYKLLGLLDQNKRLVPILQTEQNIYWLKHRLGDFEKAFKL